MQAPGYKPMKQHELAGALKIPLGERRVLRKALQRLEQAGAIVCLRKNRWALPDTSRLLIGDLSVHPDGFGFVTLNDQPTMPDVFIPARQMGTALHGDQVQIELSSKRTTGTTRRRGRRKESENGGAKADEALSGRIARVVERRLVRTAGIFKVTPHYRYVIPDNPRIKQNIQIIEALPAPQKTARDNHRVVVELLSWDDPRAPIPGRLVEDLGPADAPGVEMMSLIRSHGLDEAFPETVERSSKKIRRAGSDDMEPERRDLRDELLFTIDPEDARDFDDAVSLHRLPDGRWQLSVHIADVASYVEADSPIDKEAFRRGNSVYLVDRVITMLPRHLTEDVCSLAPNSDRRAHTVRMTISAQGACEESETFPSLIRSSMRLTYEQVQAHLNGDTLTDAPAGVTRMLTDMDHLATRLRHRRAKSGSILFEMPEVRCVLDADGTVTGILPRKAYRAYHLIEEFMLMANQAVAQLIARHGFPVPYRIHEPPDEEQWERIQIDLSALNVDLPASTREELNAIAEQYTGDPMSHIVNLAMLRNLKRAVYSPERAEHFGLAFSHYLHFTSPIRRYPDLIVHRVLKAIERNVASPYSAQEIQRIADQCSKTEREADDAEEESVTLKRIEYYAAEVEKGRIGPFTALVTSMNGRGLLVELTDTLQRGLVPFSLIRNDHYHINEHRNRAVGRRTRHTWNIGDLLKVEIVRVDKVRKLIDFRPAMDDESATTKSKRTARRGGQKGRARKGRQRIK